MRETNACKVLSETGALLRREGLYSSHLTHWRKEVKVSEQAALAPKPARTQARSRQCRVAPQRGAGTRGRAVAAQARTGRANHRGPKKLCELLGLPVGEETTR